MRNILVSVAVLACALAVPRVAHAGGPWTLPRGDIALVGSYSYQVATTEFLDTNPDYLPEDVRLSRGERDYPLNGRYTGSTYSLGIRVGFTDRLELELNLPLKIVSYQSDPVILFGAPPGTEGDAELGYYRDNVINLSDSALGLGDLTLSATYRWFLEPFAMATEVRIKAPTGYDEPEGTFGDDPSRLEDIGT